ALYGCEPFVYMKCIGYMSHCQRLRPKVPLCLCCRKAAKTAQSALICTLMGVLSGYSAFALRPRDQLFHNNGLGKGPSFSTLALLRTLIATHVKTKTE